MFVACLPRSVGRAGRPHPGHRCSTSWLRPPHRTDRFAHGGAGADVLIGVFWYCRGPLPSAARESRALRSPGLSADAQSSAEAGRLGPSPSFGVSPTTSCCLRPAGSSALRGATECREPQRSARPAHDQRLPSFFEQLALARILRTPAAGPVYRGARVSTVAWCACLRVLLRRLPLWRRKPRLSPPTEFSRRALCRSQSSFQRTKERHDQISRQITVCSAAANLAGILRDSGSGCARSAAAALNIGT